MNAVLGTVAVWNDEEGWGVLRTPDGLTVFCHCSHVAMDGFRTLEPGQRIFFDYEVPGQDGCDARVLTAARPGSNTAPLTLNRKSAGPGGGYISNLMITFDPPPAAE